MGSQFSNVTGNNIRANTDCGIRLESSRNSNISGNSITANSYGIYGFDASGSISGNNITANSIDGVDILQGGSSVVTENNIEANSRDGIFLLMSWNSNNISRNKIINNTGHGIYVAESSGQIISDNNITANSGFGILGAECGHHRISGNHIANNGNGIILSSMGGSNGNTISGNNITASKRDGIVVEGSSNIISENNLTANAGNGVHIGPSMSDSSDNEVSANRMVGNGIGVCLSGNLAYCARNNVVAANSIINNQYGIQFFYYENSHAPRDNFIHHNNFVSNTYQVDVSGSTSFWDDGYPSAGNYWSDYANEDQYSGLYQNETGSDGVWDHPYIIDVDNRDSYPLTKPLPRDIAVLSVNPSKIVVNQNDTLNLNVTVANQGASTETFNVTLCAEPILAVIGSLTKGQEQQPTTAAATITTEQSTEQHGQVERPGMPCNLTEQTTM
jgi:parallel beta-helix repeat protein